MKKFKFKNITDNLRNIPRKLKLTSFHLCLFYFEKFPTEIFENVTRHSSTWKTMEY